MFFKYDRFQQQLNMMELVLSKNQPTNVIVPGGQLLKRLESINLSFNWLANADFRPLLSIKSVNMVDNW